MAALRFNPAPGWPRPPAGWTPTPDWHPDPSWPPAPHGWVFWVDTAADPWIGYQARAPRSRAARIWMIVGAFAAVFAAMVASVILAGAVWYAADPSIIDDPARSGDFEALANGAALVPALGLVGLLAFLCPKVSYRRRDAFLVLVPFYQYYFFGLMVWRLSGLPHRDWTPRPEEVRPVASTGAFPTQRQPVAPFYT